ncbi:TNF receptor-associated factor 4-like isoform X2 [Acanthaster planci]|uniref:TNF receptor-associated factor 4-like isoform X2 n=1 Tax=Acanthaster planci TaxID=133434 RepID=A0A8B7ZFV5_ACAPL|nr:TNF receptor-associated factor 4-like isoform X2 [Acanthaster planci]
MQGTTESAGVFECPEDRLPLDYAKIYPDDKMSEEIMSLAVRCSFYKDGCKWMDKLKILKPHLESCAYNMAACTDCSAMVARNHLKDHRQFDCPKRNSTCEFCGGQFPGQRMDHHTGRCQLEVVFCENKCGAQLQRRYINSHMMNECPKRQVPCKYCAKEFIFDTLQSHLHQCPRYPVCCPNRCDSAKIAREEVDKHIKDSCPSSMASCPFVQHGCKHRGPRYSMERHLNENTKEHLGLMCHVVRRQQKQIHDLRAQLDTLSLSMDGTLLWKITDYAARFAKSKLEDEYELRSPVFATSRNGYRLQVSAFPNGNGSGEGTHLSVYIRTVSGENDALLRWPFTHPISFTLLDQAEDGQKPSHVKECFTPDPTWKNFQRPSRDVYTLGYGYPTFVSHTFLKTKHYIKNDTMFIKVEVDCSKINNII